MSRHIFNFLFFFYSSYIITLFFVKFREYIQEFVNKYTKPSCAMRINLNLIKRFTRRDMSIENAPFLLFGIADCLGCARDFFAVIVRNTIKCVIDHFIISHFHNGWVIRNLRTVNIVGKLQKLLIPFLIGSAPF